MDNPSTSQGNNSAVFSSFANNKPGVPWIVFEKEQYVYLSNIDYLNILLKRSQEAIKTLDHTKMTYIMYDLEEIKDRDELFYSLCKTLIDSEIRCIKRFIKNTFEYFRKNTIYSDMDQS